MKTKEIVSYVGGIIAFVIVAMLLRGRISEEAALGLGLLVMLLIGYPVTRYISGSNLTFGRWAVSVIFGVAVGIVVFRYL